MDLALAKMDGVELFATRLSRLTEIPWLQVQLRRKSEPLLQSTRRISRLIIVASELATNAIKFASSADIRLLHCISPRPCVLLEVVDEGAGLQDIQAALEDGYSHGHKLSVDERLRSKGSIASGLGAVQRLSDAFTLENRARGGLCARAYFFCASDTGNLK